MPGAAPAKDFREIYISLTAAAVAALLLLLPRSFALGKRFAQLPTNVHLQTIVECLANPSEAPLRGPHEKIGKLIVMA